MSSLLHEELASADATTSLLLDTLSRVDTKLSLLQAETKQLRGRTDLLHLAQSNITASFSSMETIADNFKIADEFESKGGGWDAASLVRISSAAKYLEAHENFKSAAPTLARLVALQSRVRSSGVALLETLLSEKRLVSIDGDDVKILGSLSEEHCERAKEICSTLLATGDDRPLATYGRVRGAAIKATLNRLVQNLATFLSPSSPYVAGQHPLIKLVRVVVGVLRGELDLFEFLLAAHGEAGEQAYASACEPGLKLLADACKMSCEVLQSSVWRGVEGEGFVAALDLFAAFSDSFDELLTLVEPSGSSTCLSRTVKEIRARLADSAYKGLAGVLEAVRADSTDVPESAMVAVLTSNTARSIRRLLRFDTAYSTFLSKYADAAREPLGGAAEVAERATPNTLDRLLADSGGGAEGYAVLVVTELVASLSKKQEAALKVKMGGTRMVQVGARARGLLFSLNNYRYMFKTLSEHTRVSASGSSGALAATTVDMKARYEAAVEGFCRAGWQELLDHMAPIDKGQLAYSKGGKLTFEGGRVLKARFEAFNNELEELLLVLDSLSVPDGEFRATLRSTIVAQFLPQFSSFFETYAHMPFSQKHHAQYTRYSPDIVRGKISELFAKGAVVAR